MIEIDNVPLESVRINGGTQSRAALSQSTITEYAESIRLGVDLPPVVMFFDGVHFWLADGFHRYHAHREAGAMEIAADIRTGTQRDAILYSVGANASHGLRRSNDDKRKAVETLLADPEWAGWSNNAIAKACAVSDKTVAAYRADHLRNSEDSQPEAHLRNSEDAQPETAARTVTRNGKEYQMDTAKIGPLQAPAADAAPPTSVATPRDDAPAAGPVEITEFGDAHDAPHAPKMIEVDEEAYLETIRNFEQTLADNAAMGRVFDADDRLQAAMKEVERHKASAASATQGLNSKMGENAELIRTVKQLRRDLDKERRRADAAERQLAEIRGGA